MIKPCMKPELIANYEAADLYQNSPRLYNQLVNDCVVASIRTESGLPIFNEKSELDDSVFMQKDCEVEDVITKRKVTISYETYYESWKSLATSMSTSSEFVRPNRKSDGYADKKNDNDLQVSEFLCQNKLSYKIAQHLLLQQKKGLYGNVRELRANTKAQSLRKKVSPTYVSGNEEISATKDSHPAKINYDHSFLPRPYTYIDVNTSRDGLFENNESASIDMLGHFQKSQEPIDTLDEIVEFGIDKIVKRDSESMLNNDTNFVDNEAENDLVEWSQSLPG